MCLSVPSKSKLVSGVVIRVCEQLTILPYFPLLLARYAYPALILPPYFLLNLQQSARLHRVVYSDSVSILSHFTDHVYCFCFNSKYFKIH
ncbi:hypothetical protein J6590_033109 [Homalodisca vitripennis]|nr:hypothetical protein J6590_033109 [Homalodisca vitripennis]